MLPIEMETQMNAWLPGFSGGFLEVRSKIGGLSDEVMFSLEMTLAVDLYGNCHVRRL
jgi:hypothetical protein